MDLDRCLPVEDDLDESTLSEEDLTKRQSQKVLGNTCVKASGHRRSHVFCFSRNGDMSPIYEEEPNNVQEALSCPAKQK